MSERERLRRAIRALHSVEATHLRSEPMRSIQGQTVWEGVVELDAVRAALATEVDAGRPGR